MKIKNVNRFLSLALSFAILCGMLISISVPTEATVAYADLPAALEAQKQTYVIQDTNDDQGTSESNSISPCGGEGGINRVDGEYLYVYPIYLDMRDNQLYTFSDAYIYKRGSTSATYVDIGLSSDTVNMYTNLLTSYGFLLIGWSVEGSIHLDAYRPGNFEYRNSDYEGISSPKSKSAQNGPNTFIVASVIPDDPTKSYMYGMEGTVTHYYANGSSGKISVALRANFNYFFDLADKIEVPPLP